MCAYALLRLKVHAINQENFITIRYDNGLFFRLIAQKGPEAAETRLAGWSGVTIGKPGSTQ